MDETFHKLCILKLFFHIDILSYIVILTYLVDFLFLSAKDVLFLNRPIENSFDSCKMWLIFVFMQN